MTCCLWKYSSPRPFSPPPNLCFFPLLLDIFVLFISTARTKLSESVRRKMAVNGQGTSNPGMPFPKARKITRGTVSEVPVHLSNFKSAQTKKELTLWPLIRLDVRQKKVISLVSNPTVFQGMKFGQDPLETACWGDWGQVENGRDGSGGKSLLPASPWPLQPKLAKGGREGFVITKNTESYKELCSFALYPFFLNLGGCVWPLCSSPIGAFYFP